MSWFFQPTLPAAPLGTPLLPFAEDFESGNLIDQFDAETNSYGSASLTVTGGSLIDGTYSLAMTASAESGRWIAKDLEGLYLELYVKFKIRIPSGFSYGAGGYLTFMRFLNLGGTDDIQFKLEDYGTNRLIIQGATLAYTDTAIDIPADTNTTIQIRILRNATGAVQIWVDNDTEGSPDYSDTSEATGTTGLHEARVGLPYVPNAIGTFYLDSIQIDTAFIGAGGGSFSQGLTETITLADTVLRTTSRRLIEATTLVDTVRKLPSRTLIDAIALVDTVRKTASRFLLEAVTLVDTFTGKITAKILTEAVALADIIAKTTSRTLLEAVSLVDTIRRTTTRLITETIVLADVIAKRGGKNLTEVITLIDAISKSTSRTITEAISLIDTTIRTTTRSLFEIVILTDLFEGTKITIKALLETLNVTDTISKFTSRTITEALALVDTLRRTTTRLLTEAVSLTDTLAKTSGRLITETLSLVDSIAKLTTRRLAETITATDTLIRTTTRVFLEAITLSDTFSFSRMIAVVYSETLTLADSIAKTTSKIARETLTLIDTFLGEIIIIVIKSIGHWILYSLLGLNKTVKEESKAHILSTTKQSHVVLLSERSFTVSSTDITHTNRSNTTP